MRTGSCYEGLAGRKSLDNPLCEVWFEGNCASVSIKTQSRGSRPHQNESIFVVNDATTVILAVNRNCDIERKVNTAKKIN